MIGHDERGFTLIEVIVATTILVIVVGMITAALVLYFSATEETIDRLSESPELQIASVHLVRDAQSAEFADTDAGVAKRCAPGSWAGGTHLVSFGWRDAGATTEVVGFDRAFIVSYVVTTASSNPGQKELRRFECTQLFTAPGQQFPGEITSASATTTVQSQTLIALLDPTVPATPVLVTSSKVTVSLGVCTAKSGVQACKSGSTLPFDLSITRRAA